jgi:hypothetical protein
LHSTMDAITQGKQEARTERNASENINLKNDICLKIKPNRNHKDSLLN